MYVAGQYLSQYDDYHDCDCDGREEHDDRDHDEDDHDANVFMSVCGGPICVPI